MKKKVLTIIAALMLTMTISGLAYALFSGQTTVTVSKAKTEKFTMLVTTPVDVDPTIGFYPTFVKNYTVTITNDNPYPITINGVGVTNVKWFDGETPITISTNTTILTVDSFTVEGGNTIPGKGSATVNVAVKMSESANDYYVDKNVDFDLKFVATQGVQTQ